MADPSLFVVVSTGQNVANLPPLLEHAERGDRVLWVESAEARKHRWADGTRDVLRDAGLLELKPVHVEEVNDPSEMIPACREAAAQWVGAKTYLVLNGGNKLTPFGLLSAWQQLKPVLLYGDSPKAQCWAFEGGAESKPSIRPYTKHGLDLPEILRCSGYQIMPETMPEKVWPGPEPAPERYGTDEAFTANLHSQHHQWGRIPEAGELPSFEMLTRVLPADRLRRWQRSLPALPKRENRDHPNLGLYGNVYHSALKLGHEAAKVLARMDIPNPEAALGKAFEKAVARRVWAYLESRRPLAVQSAWRTVKVVKREHLQTITAELDVLLVMRNGVLWHLECKSFAFENKDLDARLLNLQRAGSALAQMAICGPVFTGHAGEPWFAAQIGMAERVAALGPKHPFVPLTLPDQPPGYDFEVVLESALKKYEPA